MTHLLTLFLSTPPLIASEPIDLSEGIGFSEQLLHMLFSLGFVILLLIVAGWFLKKILGQRMMQMNASSEIKIIERRTLSPKSALYLIEIENQRLLVGETPTGISSLGALSPKPSTPKDFKEE